MSNLLNITIVQSKLIWQDINANQRQFEEKIQNIDNTDVIILPEMFSTGFLPCPEGYEEKPNDKTTQWMLENAKAKESVICGSIIIKEDNKYYNRFIWAQPDGEVHYYNKRHLFRMANEHKQYAQGNEQVIINYKGWRIKPLVCYDLRFPVWSRNKNDYDFMIYVANWPASRQFQWRTLLTARAIENQCYVAAVNRIGKDGNNFEYSGDSVIINPKGETLTDTKLCHEDIRTIEISMEKLKMYRETFPVMLDADNFEIKDH